MSKSSRLGWLLLGAMAALALAGCGGSSGSSSTVASNTPGGGGAGGGVSLNLGGGGAAGKGSGGVAGTTANGGSAVQDEPCPDEQVRCNGACIGLGHATPGCTVVNQQPLDFGSFTSLTLDDQYLYWVEDYVNLARAPRAGGPTERLAKSTSRIDDLKVNSTVAAWASEEAGLIFTVPKAGGEPKQVYAQPTQLFWFPALTLSESHLYFQRYGGFDQGELVGMELDGSNVVVHGSASSQLIGVAASGVMLYWMQKGKFGESDAVMQGPIAGTAAHQSKAADLPLTESLSDNPLRISGDWLLLPVTNPAGFTPAAKTTPLAAPRLPLSGGPIEFRPLPDHGSIDEEGASRYLFDGTTISELSATGEATTLFSTSSDVFFTGFATDEKSVFVAIASTDFHVPNMIVKVK